MHETEFRTWFGNSQAVDDSGQPLVVYHGTDEPFEVFRTDSEEGAFFTTNQEAAEDYGECVIAVVLSLQNPLDLTAEQWACGTTPDRAEAERAGFDGYIIRDHDISGAPGEDTIFSTVGDTYIAFYPEQIRIVGREPPDFLAALDDALRREERTCPVSGPSL